MNDFTDLEYIDAGGTDCAEPAGSKYNPRDFRGLSVVISEAGEAVVTAIASELEQMTRAELDGRSLRTRVAIGTAAEQERIPTDAVRLEYWLCNREYTRRSIPPVFRNLPEPNPDVREQVGDAFAVDLYWLVTKHADHANFRKWGGLWKPAQFHSTAKWISGNYPTNQPYWFVRGLNLKIDQQREMHLIKLDRYRSEFERLCGDMDSVRLRLRIGYEVVAKDPRHRSPDLKAAIERRAVIWLCASLDDWKKPRYQRIANLYEARTGEKISRQVVVKTIAIIQRDIPETKPVLKRPGPKKRSV